MTRVSGDRGDKTPKGEEERPPEWVLRLREFASQIAPRGFYGSVELNFQAGGVTQTNYRQSIR